MSFRSAALRLGRLVDKIAFQIGSFTVHWYGVMLAIGMLLGLWTASRRALRVNISPEHVFDSGIWIILSAVAGARFLYAISYWDRLMSDPLYPSAPWTEVFMIQRGGLVFYGGLIGGVIGGLLFVWRKKLPLWKFADVLAPSIALGYVPGRLGCLLNGCCFGSPTALPWAVHYPPEHETHAAGVHPSQVYDSLLNLLLFLALAWLFRRRKFDGQVFAAYFLGYAITRSIAEAFRGDYPPARYVATWLTPAQFLSVIIFGAGALLYWRLWLRSRHTPAPRS